MGDDELISKTDPLRGQSSVIYEEYAYIDGRTCISNIQDILGGYEGSFVGVR